MQTPRNATPVKPMAPQPINEIIVDGKRITKADLEAAVIAQLVQNGQPFTDELVIASGDPVFAARLVLNHSEIWSNGKWYEKATKERMQGMYDASVARTATRLP